MALRFPAYHTECYSVSNTTPELLRKAVRETLVTLSWSVREETHERIVGSTSMDIRSWGGKVFIQFLPDNSISVTSKCAWPLQCFDWGKNKDNVVKFMAEFSKHI
jgi:hypothetical protein